MNPTKPRQLLGLVAAAFAATAAYATSCHDTESAEPACCAVESAPQTNAHADMACCATPAPGSDAPAVAFSDTSLYQTESVWTNQNGETAPLSRLAGKPQLVALAYTSCQYACPRLLADLKLIESQLEDWPSGEIGITIVSIDPARDTPERLRQYASDNKLDRARWTLLHGDPGDVLELANLLGVRYQKTPSGDFSHSNIISLLNAEGELVHQQEGLGADPAPTLAKLKLLRSAKTPEGASASH